MEQRPDGAVRRAARRTLRVLNGELQQIAYNLQRVESVGWPGVVQIEVTNQCPVACQMCQRTHSLQRRLGVMRVVVFRSIIDQAVRSTSRVRLRHFGDSVLLPALGECIRYAAERG